MLRNCNTGAEMPAEVLKTQDPRAQAQEQLVNKLFAEYEKVANQLSALVIDKYDRDEVEARKDEQVKKLLRQKDAAYNAWQRAASRHGKMFTGQDK